MDRALCSICCKVLLDYLNLLFYSENDTFTYIHNIIICYFIHAGNKTKTEIKKVIK